MSGCRKAQDGEHAPEVQYRQVFVVEAATVRGYSMTSGIYVTETVTCQRCGSHTSSLRTRVDNFDEHMEAGPVPLLTSPLTPGLDDEERAELIDAIYKGPL